MCAIDSGMLVATTCTLGTFFSPMCAASQILPSGPFLASTYWEWNLAARGARASAQAASADAARGCARGRLGKAHICPCKASGTEPALAALR